MLHIAWSRVVNVLTLEAQRSQEHIARFDVIWIDNPNLKSHRWSVQTGLSTSGGYTTKDDPHEHSQARDIQARHGTLFLRPGEWIPWVTSTVVVGTVLLAVTVLVFHLNEKREDELERRRASHHINFDAL
ncbi:hypothetical protein B0H11DRAFT_1923707 [Mycena galericulata]|nr:hypothetical protein B0H11DRAFT_1923707 [Mycena galericulata]